MLLPVATEFDVENNILYAETDELGTYCVLDMEILLQNFGVAPDGTQAASVSVELFSANEVTEVSEVAVFAVSDETDTNIADATETEETTTADNDLVYVTFIIDIRKDGLTSSELDSVKSEIDAFAKRAFMHGRNLVVRLITQAETNFEKAAYEIVGEYKSYDEVSLALSKIEHTKDSTVGYIFDGCCNISEALNAAISLSAPDAKKYIFDVYSQENAIYEYNISDMLSAEIRADDITVGIITEYEDEFIGYQRELLTTSMGIVYNRFEDFGDSIYDFIWHSEDVVPTETYPVILSTGYQYVELKSKLYPNGANPCGVDSDTDDDGTTDWDEVDVDHWVNAGLIIYNDNTIKLPTLKQCMNYIELTYVKEGLNRFLGTFNVTNSLSDIEVLPICSDPTSEDGDRDKYIDGQDLAPLVPFVNPIIMIHGRVSNTSDTYGLVSSICMDNNGNISPNNNHFNSHLDMNGNSYTNISSQAIKKVRQSTLGAYFVKKGYVQNKNLFAFNYPNQDFSINNGSKLDEYIENIKYYVSNNLEDHNDIDATVSDIFATKNDFELSSARFILVGHSNGGLVSRYYIENMGGSKNVDKLITIDTPHYGSGVCNLSYISTVALMLGINTPATVPLE